MPCSKLPTFIIYISPVCFLQGIRKDSFQPNPPIREQQNIQLLKHWKMYRDVPLLNSYDSNYHLRLLDLQLLPLMMVLKINDILFFIKSLKEPCDHIILTFLDLLHFVLAKLVQPPMLN